MSLLNFNKPKKAQSTEDWKNFNGFDGGPDGGYSPNMSQEDQKRWKAKRFNIGKVGDCIELRKTMGGSQVLIIVAPNGWSYKNEKPEERPKGAWSHHDTRGLNVRISMNGPLLLTYDEFFEIDQIVKEAKELFES